MYRERLQISFIHPARARPARPPSAKVPSRRARDCSRLPYQAQIVSAEPSPRERAKLKLDDLRGWCCRAKTIPGQTSYVTAHAPVTRPSSLYNAVSHHRECYVYSPSDHYQDRTRDQPCDGPCAFGTSQTRATLDDGPGRDLGVALLLFLLRPCENRVESHSIPYNVEQSEAETNRFDREEEVQDVVVSGRWEVSRRRASNPKTASRVPPFWRSVLDCARGGQDDHMGSVDEGFEATVQRVCVRLGISVGSPE